MIHTPTKAEIAAQAYKHRDPLLSSKLSGLHPDTDVVTGRGVVNTDTTSDMGRAINHHRKYNVLVGELDYSKGVPNWAIY